MTCSHLKPGDYLTTRWSGGTTTQLAIAPAGAVYADRDFLWRLSSATVETEESDFTALPDYDRLISTLTGDIRLNHNGGAILTLHPYEVHRFDGADATHSWGCCRDFNLMLRKGRCSGDLRGEVLVAGEKKTLETRQDMLMIYCGEGSAEIRTAEGCIVLSANEAARLDGPGSVELHSPAGARLMLATVSERR